jgi:uncharacterized membrane-anchored protein
MDIDNLDRQPVEPMLEPELLTEANPDRSPKLPLTRLVVPLFLQLLLICSVSAQSMYVLATGKTVIIKTMPVDPYDLLRGYYQILSYDISSFNTFEKLPGWSDLTDRKENKTIKKNQQVYVTLAKQPLSQQKGLQAWQPIAIGSQLPPNLSVDQIAIKGVSNGNSIVYGLETYYMPEDRKDGINADINQSQNRGRRNLLVEIKVDSQGVAIPISLWVGEKQYRF